MQQTPHQRKTLTERVIHAITFEGLATLILAPTAAWLMQRSVVEMGGLSILLATLAMVWNIIPESDVISKNTLTLWDIAHCEKGILFCWGGDWTKNKPAP